MKNIHRIILFFTFLFYLLCSQIYSQTYYHKIYNVEEGLSQSQVISLYQDKKGNLWLGTNGGGINIYNGKEFKPITKDDGLIGNYVNTITEDSKGNIWIGTSKGISIYNGSDFINYTEDDGLPDNRVWKIIEDSSKTIWVGTDKGVAYFMDNHFKILEGNETLKNACVFTIFSDKSGNIWFGTLGNGLIKYNQKIFEIFTTEENLYHNNIRTIIQDTTGNIWIGTDNGLNIYKDNIIYKTNSEKIYTASLISKRGELWLCNFQGVLSNCSFTNDNLQIKKNIKFKNTRFRALLKDIEGNFWIGTDGKGLIKFPHNVFYNYSEEDDLHNNIVFSICETTSGEFWIGSFSKGVSNLKINDDGSAKFKNYQHENTENTIIGNKVFSIIEDKNNNIWFGTWNGVSKYNVKDSIFYNFTTNDGVIVSKDKHCKIVPNLTSEIVNTIFEDSKGIIWLGTKNGVTRVVDTTFYNFNEAYKILEGKNIWKIFEDNDNNHWFATDNGAYVFDGSIIKHFGKEQGFIDEKVISIVQDKRGNYWFGTKQGVFRYDSSFFEIIDKNKGLASNNVYLLILDNEDNLFIGTDKGLDKLDTKNFPSANGKKINIRHYGNLEGFIGQECNLNACYKDKKGRLWFGTIKGLTIYCPEYDKINRVKPITQITNIKLSFKDIDWEQYSDGLDSVTHLPTNLVLPYNKNHLTFSFIAVSLTIPEKVRYQYMLEGLDDDWLPVRSEKEAIYSSIPYGDYIFKVKACNNDGIWNEIPTTFSFTITPPFWKTWWFITIIVILSALIIYIYINVREANLKKEKIVLAKKVRERTHELLKQKEIVEQKNKDITDSINYAKNIQEAILPSIHEINNIFPDSFILYKPRDIVSGDFYWMSKKENKVFITASDCTGHGVPGAFMSMLGIAFLNEIVSKAHPLTPSQREGGKGTHLLANEILNQLREQVISSLHQTGKKAEAKDGMDIALCILNMETNELQYAGANNPLYLILNDRTNNNDRILNDRMIEYKEHSNIHSLTHSLIEVKADRMPIGIYIGEEKQFTNHKLQLQKGDTIYIFSDGYPDQFGGDKGKKFKYKQFKQLLLDIQNKSMEEQKSILAQTIEDWQGDLEQVDDILVIGIRI